MEFSITRPVEPVDPGTDPSSGDAVDLGLRVGTREAASHSDEVRTLGHRLRALGDREGDVPLGDVVDALGARGFGPLLFALAGLLILPIGMIPGVGGAVGVVIAATAVQILRGTGGVWLPDFVRRRVLPAGKVRRAGARLRPVSAWLLHRLAPRWTILAEGRLSLTLIALVLMLAAAVLLTMGFIPILPPLLGLPILLFATGLTTRDGRAIALGYLLVLPALAFVAHWALSLGE